MNFFYILDFANDNNFANYKWINSLIMGWKQKIFSNMFFRNMLADFGERSSNSKTSGNFTPYFQYKIGENQSDLYLYFPKEPFSIRYKNEIFNKLNEYTGYGIIKFLEFHYWKTHQDCPPNIAIINS